MTNASILRSAAEQHAIDANCSPDDFARRENVVVISRPDERARKYLTLPQFCSLISYGSNIVASVDERVREFVTRYIEKTDHIEHCFEPTPDLIREFARYGYDSCWQAEYWLPDVDALRALPCRFETRLLEPPDFAGLYRPEWGDALCEKRKYLDVLAVGAYDGGALVGLAGCSADCAAMWQIGVDVLPAYRRQGIAAALTSRLAAEILARGKVPFYCCAWANLGSARNAIRSGFRPAWAELGAVKRESGDKS